jgi:hypothetical protein
MDKDWIVLGVLLVSLVLSFLFFSSLASFVFGVSADVSPVCSLNYTVSGEKDVDVYFCDGGFSEGVVGESVLGGDVIRVDRGEVGSYEGVILVHELGHSLGYGHEVGGVMDESPEEPYNEESLSEVEMDIVNSFDGFVFVDWDSGENVDYALNKSDNEYDYMVGKECESIFYDDSVYKDWWAGDRFYNLCL